MTISLADLLFCAGVGCTLTGAWLRGLGDGLIATGIAICLLAVVLQRGYVRLKRSGKRQ